MVYYEPTVLQCSRREGPMMGMRLLPEVRRQNQEFQQHFPTPFSSPMIVVMTNDIDAFTKTKKEMLNRHITMRYVAT